MKLLCAAPMIYAEIMIELIIERILKLMVAGNPDRSVIMYPSSEKYSGKPRKGTSMNRIQ